MTAAEIEKLWEDLRGLDPRETFQALIRLFVFTETLATNGNAEAMLQLQRMRDEIDLGRALRSPADPKQG